MNTPDDSTSAQAMAVSASLYNLALALGNYRLQGLTMVPPLPYADSMELSGYQSKLLSLSQSFATKTVATMLRDLQDDLAAVTQITQQATHAIATIKLVKTVITVTTAVVELGGAILSKDPAAIAKKTAAAVQAAQGALKQAPGSTT